jgi:hypothetical protein
MKTFTSIMGGGLAFASAALAETVPGEPVHQALQPGGFALSHPLVLAAGGAFLILSLLLRRSSVR